MARSSIQAFGLFLLIVLSCRADLTLRYTIDANIGGAMPPTVVDAMKLQMASVLPKEKVIRIKADRALSGIGAITGIIDNAAQEVTLLNPATKQYARIPLADYVAAIQAATPLSPAAQQAIERMKFDVQTSAMGQMAMVFGIRAEEHLTTMTLSMDGPGAAAAGPLARIEVRTWLASPDDLDRIPGLRQYADHAQRALAVFNSADEIQKLFSQVPGLGEKMRAMTAQLTKNAGSLTVKMQENLYMPMVAQLAQARTQSDPPKTDPNAPFMKVHMDLAAISNDAIDDSVFDVPSDYRPAPVSDLIQALKPAAVQLPKADRTAAPVAPVTRSPDLDAGDQISRVGGQVSAPSLIYRRDPVYTEEARRAKLSGSVLLSVVVDKEGNPRNIQVVRSLGLGLDEKAIDAVSQWRFRPGQKDGQPVNVRASIQVNFKLRIDPPQQ